MNTPIPPFKNPAEKSGATLPTADESAIRKILVVDDDTSTADTLVELLSILGWVGKATYSAREAMEFLKTHKPDLIFLDIDMPEMSGYEFVRLLRSDERFAELPIVAITGFGMEEDKIKAIQTGFTAHITKPISARDLREILTGDIGA